MTQKEDLMRQLLSVNNALVLNKIKAVLDEKINAETASAPTGFISAKEAQRFLGGISRGHLWNLRRKGLKSYTVGGRIVFLPDELKDWVLKEKSSIRPD